MSFPGNIVAVTATSTPGTTLYTGPLRSGQAIRIQVRAMTVGTSLSAVTIEHDVGAEHPFASAGIKKVVDAYRLPIVGLPVLILDHIIFGGSSDPDKLTAYVDANTVNFLIEVELVKNF